MIRPLVTILAFTALTTTAAPPSRANSLPGRHAEPRLRFENLEAYPDYVFFLHFQRYPWYGPATAEQVREIRPGVPFTMPGSGSWRDHLYVEAVPRPGKDGRVLRSPALQSPRDYVTSVDLYEHYVTPYRIREEKGEEKGSGVFLTGRKRLPTPFLFPFLFPELSLTEKASH